MSLSSPFICFEINRRNFLQTHFVSGRKSLGKFSSLVLLSCLRRSDNGQVKLFASTRKPLLWWVGEIMVSNFVFGSAREDFHLAIESYVNSVLIALREFSDKKGETKHNTCRLWKRSSTSTTCLCYWLVWMWFYFARKRFAPFSTCLQSLDWHQIALPTAADVQKYIGFRQSSLETTFLPRICMSIKARRKEISLMRNCFLCSLPSGGLNSFLRDKRKVFWLVLGKQAAAAMLPNIEDNNNFLSASQTK